MSQLGELPQATLPQVPPLPNVPQAVATRRLGKDPANLVGLIGSQITATAFRLAMCKTAKEFLDLRTEVFRRYAQLSAAAANIVAAEARDIKALTELTDDSFVEFEKTFREKVEALLSPDAASEALFSISTLRRTYKLWNRIVMTPVPAQNEPEDRETAASYNLYILWSQLHLDCLLMAFASDIRLSEEIISEVLSGLRSSVMAYSCARHGVRLREFPRQFDFTGPDWDETDQALAAQSTREREAMLGGW